MHQIVTWSVGPAGRSGISRDSGFAIKTANETARYNQPAP